MTIPGFLEQEGKTCGCLAAAWLICSRGLQPGSASHFLLLSRIGCMESVLDFCLETAVWNPVTKMWLSIPPFLHFLLKGRKGKHRTKCLGNHTKQPQVPSQRWCLERDGNYCGIPAHLHSSKVERLGFACFPHCSSWESKNVEPCLSTIVRVQLEFFDKLGHNCVKSNPI